jgi:SWI/SNF-related matrix-associated actin-dependent regulator 1 of chromatin subfamily A
MNNKLDDLLAGLTEQTEGATEVLPKREIVRVEPEGSPFELYEFQNEALDHALEKKRSLCGLEMGLGKTPIMAHASLACVKAGVSPILVVVPPSLRLNTRIEFERFCPELSTEILLGRKPHEIPDVDVLIMGDTSVNDWADALVEHKIQSIICDEAHRYKNPKAQRSQGLLRISRSLPDDGLRLLCSGTFTTNGRPQELAVPLQIISRTSDLMNGKVYEDPIDNFQHTKDFLNRYSPPDGKGFGGRAPAVQLLPELHERLGNYAHYHRKLRSEVTDLPNKARSIVFIEPDKKVEKKYIEAEEDLRSYLKGEGRNRSQIERAFRAETLVKLGVLRKLCGLMKVESTCKYAQDLMDMGEKVFIVTYYKDEANMIAEKLNAVKIVGGMSDHAKQQSVERFSKDVDALVGNQVSAGVGFTLHGAEKMDDGSFSDAKCRHVITHSLAWHSSDLQQCEDRIHRIGQNQEVISSIEIAGMTDPNRQSIDIHVWGLIEAKYDHTAMILDGREADLVDIDDIHNHLIDIYSN